MLKVRLFKDLKKNVQIEYKKNENLCFFYKSLWSKNFIFSLGVIFSKFLDGVKEKASKHHTR